jgi:hypothetical protein
MILVMSNEPNKISEALSLGHATIDVVAVRHQLDGQGAVVASNISGPDRNFSAAADQRAASARCGVGQADLGLGVRRRVDRMRGESMSE